ncbi:Feruloyl esterase [Neopestalotiopsis sp. 37M]|nr:Feruloyl esterase [Neopestalotiopsis sp. 37M]
MIGGNHLLSLVFVGAAAASAALDASITNSTTSTDDFELACSSFATQLSIDNVTDSFTEYIPARGNMSYNGVPAVCQSTQTASVDVCRVYLNVSTSYQSGIRFEAWFPREYNGRFLSTGNNGLSGCVKHNDVDFGTKFGFATVGANSGHDGDTAEDFYHNSDVLADFSWRSVHTGVMVGKQLTEQFYEQGYNKSYYIGCSTGGRQGYKAAQANPDDFDGILAGSAAMNNINLMSWGLRMYYLTGNSTADTYLTEAQWTAVHEEILKQCDGLDGADDGTIDDVDLCHPILQPLICNSTSTTNSTCLTGKQATTVEAVLSDFYGPDCKLYYPRLNPGAEADAFGIYLSGTPFSTAESYYKYVVKEDPDWDSTTWTPEDAETALSRNPSNLQSFDADLSTYRARGGKLFTYHGTADPIISSDDSKLYYRNVANNMSASPSDLDDFYRFFSIGGMGHCGSGDAAIYIGQSGDTYLDSEPENNMLLQLVDWVENGVAPDYVRGAASTDGDTATFYRRHCKYPLRNQYVGPGNYTDESAWQCVQ